MPEPVITEDPPKAGGLNAADTQALVQDALSSLGYAVDAPKDPPKEGQADPKPAAEEKPPEEPKDDKPAKPAGEEKPKPPTPTVSKRPAQPAFDAAEFAKTVASETGKAVAAELSKPKAGPAAEPDAELDDTEAGDIEVLEHLEKTNPGKYTGLAQKTKAFYKDVLGPYKDQWTKANPGKEFNPEDEDHAEIYARQPEISDADFDRASKNLEREKITAEVEKKFEPKIKEITRKQIERDLVPSILKEGQDAVEALVKEAAPELAELLADEKAVEKMTEKDPLAADILDKSARVARAAAAEFAKLMAPDLEYKFDPKGNVIHREIGNHIPKYEQKIQALPPEEQVWKGLKFATLNQWADMTEAQRKNHWVISWRDIKGDFFSDFAAETKRILTAEREKYQKWADRSGYKKAETPQPKEPAPVEEEPPKPKPKPPAITSSSDLVTPAKPAAKGNLEFGEQIAHDLFA